jgi:homocysteine S-methyltransferase
VTDKPVFVCPNLGQHRESVGQTLPDDTTEAALLGGIPTWLGLGVTHIGGCCGVGPETIRTLARVVAETGARSSAGACSEPV